VAGFGFTWGACHLGVLQPSRCLATQATVTQLGPPNKPWPQHLSPAGAFFLAASVGDLVIFIRPREHVLDMRFAVFSKFRIVVLRSKARTALYPTQNSSRAADA
jgi:hypothetical protein